MASVIGVDFWFNILLALTEQTPGINEASLRSHLTSLQRTQLIYERGQVPDLGMRYSFRSSLLRDAAYDGLLTDQRQAYHLITAETIEDSLNLEFLGQNYGLLAYQYRNARVLNKELFYTLQSAEQARRVYANEEALSLYTRALEILDELEPQAANETRLFSLRSVHFEVLQGRLEIFNVSGQRQASIDDAQDLLKLARLMGSQPAWLIDALLLQPPVQNWHSKEECMEGPPLAQEALELARKLGDREREMQALGIIARQQMTIGDPSWQSKGEEALQLARQLKDRASEARLLQALGTAYSWNDQAEKGMQYLQDALPICKELEDKITEVNLLSNMGLALERSGDYVGLLKDYHEERLCLSREIGYRQGEVAALISCGQIQAVYLGDYEVGLQRLQEARQMTDVEYQHLLADLRIVQIGALTNRHSEVQGMLEVMLQGNDTRFFHNARAGIRLVAAIFYATLDCSEANMYKALDAIRDFKHIAAEAPMLSRQYTAAAACESSSIYLKLAGCAASESRRREHLSNALQCAEEAVNLFKEFGFIQVTECSSQEILFRCSQVQAANGQTIEAAEYLQAAYQEMMRKHKLIPDDSPYQKTFLEKIALHKEIASAYGASFLAE
jgi:hypothetical protein